MIRHLQAFLVIAVIVVVLMAICNRFDALDRAYLATQNEENVREDIRALIRKTRKVLSELDGLLIGAKGEEYLMRARRDIYVREMIVESIAQDAKK